MFDRLIDEYLMDGEIHRCMNGWIDRQIVKGEMKKQNKLYRYLNRQTDRDPNEQIDRQEQTYEKQKI